MSKGADKPKLAPGTPREPIRRTHRSTRKRYVSRRQRLRKHLRAWRLAFLAIGLALVVVIVLSWRDIYTYVRFYFMD